MERLRHDWSAIQLYYDAGHSFLQCREHFGFSAQSWYKAVARGRLLLSEHDFRLSKSRGPGNPVYDWAAVQAYYDEGNSYRKCRERFGFCAASWSDAVRRGALTARARRWHVEELLLRAKCRTHIKNRLLEAGILCNRCDHCGLSEWRGKPLSIQIDHANGDAKDNRLENLRMLCPNCHAQTETYSGRNVKRFSLFPGGVIGNTPDSDSGDSRFETLPGSHWPYRLEA